MAILWPLDQSVDILKLNLTKQINPYVIRIPSQLNLLKQMISIKLKFKIAGKIFNFCERLEKSRKWGGVLKEEKGVVY